MRNRLTGRLPLLILSFAMLLAIPALALADTLTVSNTLVTNTDTTKAPGGTGTANVWLEATNNDPSTPEDKTGCNASTAAGQAATVTLSSNNSAISFPNGNSAQLTDCGSNNAKQVAYKVADNAQAGQAVITGSVSGGKSGQTNQYNTNDALTVTITAPAKQNTTVSLDPTSGTYGGSATLKATLKTAAGTALSGKTVDFKLNGTSAGSATTDASGIATKSVSLSGIDAGTYTHYVSANFAGDTSNNGFTASGDLTVNQAQATLTLNGLGGHTYDGSAQGATVATTPSGLSGVNVTYNGNAQAPTNAGTYNVVASLNNTNYQAQNATGTMVIAKATPQITWSNPADITYGTQLGATQLNASSNVAGTFSYTPTSGTRLDAGDNQSLKADFTPNDTGNYNGASKTVQINVNKANQAALNYTGPTTGTYGDKLTLSSSGGSGTGAVTYDVGSSSACALGTGADAGKLLITSGTGSCTLTANKAADGNYNSATSGPQTINVSKATSTVNLGNLTQTYDGTVKAASATTTPSGLNVDFAYTQNGNAATPRDAGDYNVVATVNSNNYQGSASGTLKIDKADATINVDGYTGVYDGNAHGATGTAKGVNNEDLNNLLDLGAKFTNVPGGAVNWTFAGNSNYKAASGDANIAITARPITVEADAKSKVYGEDDPALTYQVTSGSLVNGDTFSGQLSRDPGDSVAGSPYAIKQGTLSAGGNYNLTYNGANLTITAKQVTGSFTADDKVYDGNTSATVASKSLPGVVGADDVTLNVTNAQFDNKNVGTGKDVTASLALSGTDAGNYSLSSTTATAKADIKAKQVTGSFTADNKVYDGNNSATVTGRSLTGAIAGDAVNLDGGAATFADKNVGNGKTVTLSGASLTGTASGNYTLGSVDTTTANITPLGISGSFTAPDKEYDGNASATITDRNLQGVLGSDAVSLTGGTASFDNKNVGRDKPVSGSGFTLAGADKGNYTLGKVSDTTASITAKQVTGSFTASNKEYDGTTSASISGRSLDGVVSGDDVDLTGGTASFGTRGVGTGKTVTGTGFSLTGTDAGNYTLASSNLNTTANITPKELTGSFTAKDKVYDGNTDAQIGSSNLNGVVSGDVVSLNGDSASFADKNVGQNKTVTVNRGDLSGADAGNYTLKAGPWTAEANITPLGINGSFTASDKVYDGNASATINGRNLQGVLGSDAVSLTGGTASFDNKNVGRDKPVSGSGFTLAGGDAGNYTLGTVPGTTASITAKALNASFTADNKTYDGNNSASATANPLQGVAAGDTVNLVVTNAHFSDKNVGNGKTVTANLSLSGTDAGNYSVPNTATTTASITARDLTVSASGINKEYDGNASATVNLSTDKLAGDVVTATYNGASFANKNVGTGKVVSVNGISISGADAGNYNLTNTTASTTANITTRTLTFTAAAQNKVYDGNANTTVSLSDNRVSGDALSTSYTNATFADKNAGTGKVVTVSGISVTGADAGNYTYNTITTTSANIAQRSITVTADAKSKLFGDPDPALTYQVSGGPLVTGDSFSGSLTRTQGEAVGSYDILQGSVTAGPNYAITYNGAKLTIGAWTFKGFYQPVDMSGVYNTVKGGSTVPFKFELFKGTTELTDTANIKQPLQATKVSCSTGAVEDTIELLATGATVLRYDATDGQFIYNWKTPTGAGTCYRVTITANDGSSASALFKIK